jgi:hypothetical protein
VARTEANARAARGDGAFSESRAIVLGFVGGGVTALEK